MERNAELLVAAISKHLNPVEPELETDAADTEPVGVFRVESAVNRCQSHLLYSQLCYLLSGPCPQSCYLQLAAVQLF